MAKILLVEDQEMNRDMLSRRLKKRGYEVAIAVDGAEGVEKARSEPPDLILMDRSLPVMDGWEATRILKGDEATRSIPVVALTAHAMSTDRDKALDAQLSCDRVRAEAADDPADRDAGRQGGEQALRPPAGDEIAQRQPDRQKAEGEQLSSYQHEGSEDRRRVPRLQKHPERQKRRRQTEENARQHAGPIGGRQQAAGQAGGHHQQPGAREQHPREVGDSHALQEEGLRGVEERESGGRKQGKTQARPTAEHPLRRLDANAAQGAVEGAHRGRNIEPGASDRFEIPPLFLEDEEVLRLRRGGRPEGARRSIRALRPTTLDLLDRGS
jgi:CheY-like chemotaxis protein